MEKNHEAACGCPCCQVEEMAQKACACVRKHPESAALAGGCAGFVLAQLPWWRLLKVGFGLIKPAVIFYGLYRLAEDYSARQGCRGKSSGE